MKQAGPGYDPVGTAIREARTAGGSPIATAREVPTGSHDAMKVAGLGDRLDGIAIPKRARLATGRVAALIRRHLDPRMVCGNPGIHEGDLRSALRA